MRGAWLMALALAACRPPPPGEATGAPEGPFVSLERQECFGECPVYRIAAYRDGEVRFAGERYVAFRGRYIGRLDAAQIKQLDETFADFRFLDLAERYVHQDWTDMETVKLGYVAPDGRTRFVEHYHGDESAPRALAVLETNVDLILRSRRWVGTPCQSGKVRTCRSTRSQRRPGRRWGRWSSRARRRRGRCGRGPRTA